MVCVEWVGGWLFFDVKNGYERAGHGDMSRRQALNVLEGGAVSYLAFEIRAEIHRVSLLAYLVVALSC